MEKNLDLTKPQYSSIFFQSLDPSLCLGCTICYVVVSFYPWFKFYFLLLVGMVLYVYGFETKENEI